MIPQWTWTGATTKNTMQNLVGTTFKCLICNAITPGDQVLLVFHAYAQLHLQVCLDCAVTRIARPIPAESPVADKPPLDHLLLLQDALAALTTPMRVAEVEAIASAIEAVLKGANHG